VSVGLPVYNGERYLREAVESVLAQTFEGFELIIRDNASVDATGDISRELRAKDPRVRYERSTENLGAARNFNRAFELSRGEYFLWLSHDDYYAPDYLERCVQVLDANPEVVLCYPLVQIVDELGEPVQEYGGRLKRAASERTSERFGELILVHHWCREVFGMMRVSALRETGLIGNYVQSDRTLLAHLALLGPFFEIKEMLFHSREHAGRSMRAYKNEQSRAEWFDSKSGGRVVFPHWRLIWEYSKLLPNVPMGFAERLRCYREVARWGSWNRHQLAEDLWYAAHLISHRDSAEETGKIPAR